VDRRALRRSVEHLAPVEESFEGGSIGVRRRRRRPRLPQDPGPVNVCVAALSDEVGAST
jgi:hypothetical protein